MLSVFMFSSALTVNQQKYITFLDRKESYTEIQSASMQDAEVLMQVESTERFPACILYKL